ncbi:MAG: hypothetical protein MUC96_18055 [Myxococcaceae bacterium]|nr:hypothetical protein [Myxococcaceae bacterium]
MRETRTLAGCRRNAEEGRLWSVNYWAVLFVVVSSAGCIISSRFDFERDLSATREAAINDYLRTGECLHHRVQRCPSDDRYTSISSYTWHSWAYTAHDRVGRRVFTQSGGCTGVRPAEGFKPVCSEEEVMVRDLCSEVLTELQITRGKVEMRCNGQPMLSWAFDAPSSTLEGPGFALRVERPEPASEGLFITLVALESETRFNRCSRGERTCTTPLSPNDELFGEFDLSRGDSTLRCHLELRLRYARGRCESCAAPAVTTTKP